MSFGLTSYLSCGFLAVTFPCTVNRAWTSRGVWLCQADFWTPPCDPSVCLTVSYLSLFVFFFFLYCSSLVHPAETANLVPALYRQSNQRPTSLKPTSTSCRLSWHVSPNVPASSSPRSTVYRSETGQVGLQSPKCLHSCFYVSTECLLLHLQYL